MAAPVGVVLLETRRDDGGMRILVALVVAVGACVGPAGPPGPQGENGADGTNGMNGSDGASGSPAEDFASGQRIKARATTTVTSTADGAMRMVTSFGGWFDSMRNEPCAPALASDGKTRCLPGALLAISYYADNLCTIPAAIANDASCTAIPTYLAAPPPSQSCSGTVGSKIYARGSGVTSYYSKSGLNCVGPNTLPGFTWYPIAGAEISPSSFAEMTVTVTTQ